MDEFQEFGGTDDQHTPILPNPQESLVAGDQELGFSGHGCAKHQIVFFVVAHPTYRSIWLHGDRESGQLLEVALFLGFRESRHKVRLGPGPGQRHEDVIGDDDLELSKQAE